LFTGESFRAKLSHDGDGNFTIWQRGVNERDTSLLVNEIGQVEDHDVWLVSPALIDIAADGNWSIERY